MIVITLLVDTILPIITGLQPCQLLHRLQFIWFQLIIMLEPTLVPGTFTLEVMIIAGFWL